MFKSESCKIYIEPALKAFIPLKVLCEFSYLLLEVVRIWNEPIETLLDRSLDKLRFIEATFITESRFRG